MSQTSCLTTWDGESLAFMSAAKANSKQQITMESTNHQFQGYYQSIISLIMFQIIRKLEDTKN